MVDHIGRSSVVLLATAALLLSGLAGSGVAASECKPVDVPEQVTNPASFDEPFAVIYFDWTASDDVMVTYFATTSWDPEAKYPRYEAVWTGGCPDGIVSRCRPIAPLILTEAKVVPGYNNTSRTHGTYTLAAEPKGACIYWTEQGERGGNWDTERAYPSEFGVSALVEHYRAGDTVGAVDPYATEGPFTTTLDFWPTKGGVFQLPNPAPYRKALGTFTWPGTEVVARPFTLPTDDEPVTITFHSDGKPENFLDALGRNIRSLLSVAWRIVNR